MTHEEAAPGAAPALAAAQGAAQATTESPTDGPPALYRRIGLLNTVLVDRRGDRYIVSRGARNEAIESVLWFRMCAIEYHRLPRDCILPYRVHSQALARFKQWFVGSRLAQRAIRSCQQFKGDGMSSAVYNRNYRSQLRVALFEAFGGSDWMNLLLAVGALGINQDLVDCYNAELDCRTPSGPLAPPRLSARSLAAARGQPLPPVQGVQHHRTPAYNARMQARELDRQAQIILHPGARQEAMRAADLAWEPAHALSDAAGVAYTDRHGQRVREALDHTSMVTCVLERYAERRRIEYDQSR